MKYTFGSLNYPETPHTAAVAKSVAKPDAFAKAGSMGHNQGKWAPGKGVRFRALHAKRTRGRPRKPDDRYVNFY
jgi:hypothetical protein